MKRFLYCILILCCCIASTQARVIAETDSLQLLLPTLPQDSTRLEVIRKILQIEQSNSKCIYFSDMLFEEATAQKNNRYAGTAIYFQLVYYYNHNELDSVSKRLPLMKPYVQKANLWEFYFDAIRCEIDLYTYREQYEFAINKAFKLFDAAKEKKNIRGQIAAYQCLANAYIGTGRSQKGKEALEAAHKLLPLQGKVTVHNNLLSQLIALSRDMKDYPGLLKYLKEQKKLIKDYLTIYPSMKKTFDNPNFFHEIYYTYYYNDTKQPQQAWEHMVACRKYLTENSYFLYKIMYKDACACYYQSSKDYNRALQYTDSTINEYKENSSSDYIHQLRKKADILTEAGRNQEALNIYRKVLLAKDSLENERANKQMKLIQENYHVDKVLLEKKQRESRIQLITLVLIVSCVIVLFFLMHRVYHVRKALRRSEQETQEATRVAEEANEMKNRFLTNMSYNIRIPLNGVVGFSQLIALEPNMNEETRKEYSTIIQKNSEELMRLVNDVLDLSRLEAKMMKFQMQEYDVIALCNDTIYRTRMEEENPIHIDFRTNITEGQNIQVDTNQLTRVLLSALTYPVKSQTPREIIFTLTLDAEAGWIRFSINNTPLADSKFRSQEVSIRHDINQLLLKHFGGTYTVQENAPEGPTIVFTYPLNISE